MEDLCPICGKEVGYAGVDIGGEIRTHLDCFYNEDIPNISESTKEERKSAMDAKVNRLMEEKGNE